MKKTINIKGKVGRRMKINERIFMSTLKQSPMNNTTHRQCEKCKAYVPISWEKDSHTCPPFLVQGINKEEKCDLADLGCGNVNCKDCDTHTKEKGSGIFQDTPQEDIRIKAVLYGTCNLQQIERIDSLLAQKVAEAREEAYEEGQKHAFGVDRERVKEEGRKEERVKIYELVHKHAMETKDTKTLDLLEKIQGEIIK